MEGTTAIEALRKAYRESRPEGKPALLRALAKKDAQGAGELVRAAAAGSDPELKITALDILGTLGDPGMEAVYLEVARGGSPAVRPVALRGYLAVAKKRLEAKEQEAAFAMYERALESATGPDRSEALQGLIDAGGTKAIDRVAALLKDPALGAEAARGYVELAGKLREAGETDRAEKVLVEVVRGDFSGELRTKALRQLKEMNRDPQNAARAQGFLVDWWVVGPMEDRNGRGLERKLFPEEVIDLEKEHSIGARRYRWKTLDTISLDGKIQLAPVFRRSENVIAYAFAKFESSAPQDVVFKMGSDDGIACFLNGERIHLKDAARSLKVDEDAVPAKLVAGSNSVLLKIRNTDGDWAFAFRVTDPKGNPVDLPVTSVRAR